MPRTPFSFFFSSVNVGWRKVSKGKAYNAVMSIYL